jgi:DNA-binding response OmpR family regulator
MTAQRKKKVLIAEDEQSIRELIAYRLTQSGYTVMEASDGEEALRLAAADTPDIAVLDVMMPHLDGYQLTARLKEAPATARVPVILLTARVQEADITQGFDAGADDYLRKPFSPDELVSRVRAVLSRTEPAGP